MSPHHSDQMSQRSQVSRATLCMSKVKVLWVSESVTRSPIELFWTAKKIISNISKVPFSPESPPVQQKRSLGREDRRAPVKWRNFLMVFLLSRQTCTFVVFLFLKISLFPQRLLAYIWCAIMLEYPICTCWHLCICVTTRFGPNNVCDIFCVYTVFASLENCGVGNNF